MNDQPKTIANELVSLVDIAHGATTLEGWTFSNCQVNGPVVLVVLDSKTTFEECNLGGTQEQILWVIPVERRNVSGALGLIDCHFQKCLFRNVGFAGHPDVIDRMRAELLWGHLPPKESKGES